MEPTFKEMAIVYRLKSECPSDEHSKVRWRCNAMRARKSDVGGSFFVLCFTPSAEPTLHGVLFCTSQSTPIAAFH